MVKIRDFFKRNKKQFFSVLSFSLIMMTSVAFADFWSEGIDALSKLIRGIGVGLAIWGIVNLLEGYGNDNPAAKNQGIKQLVAGGAIFFLIPKLAEALKTVFN